MNSYREFWPFYVSQHRKPGTRALHFLGTSAVLLCVVAALATRTWWLLLLAPVRSAALAGALLFAVGCQFTIWTANNQAIVQLAAPTRLRGRVICT